MPVSVSLVNVSADYVDSVVLLVAFVKIALLSVSLLAALLQVCVVVCVKKYEETIFQWNCCFLSLF